MSDPSPPSLLWLLELINEPIEAPSEAVAAHIEANRDVCIICGEAALAIACQPCAEASCWAGFDDNSLRMTLGDEEAAAVRRLAGPLRMFEVEGDDTLHLVRAHCAAEAAELVDPVSPQDLGVVASTCYNVSCNPDADARVLRRLQ